jgi:flavin-dependent thymidylate synthase
MYRGEVAYSLSELTDAERQEALTEVQKTHLKAPMESIELMFVIEGVTRSFTHQMVRQRTAVYAQESMRFAVKEEAWTDITSLPPSLAGTKPFGGTDTSYAPSANKRQRMRDAWDDAIMQAEAAYKYLISEGMPAEDARGLAPHAMTTRLVYKTNLRNLMEHAGNRLCTQAQFEWRIVLMGIVKAIRNYVPTIGDGPDRIYGDTDRWQFQAIADSAIFRPVCYQLGRCPFKANVDRACSIRDRVDAFADHGVKSDHWGQDHKVGNGERWLSGINPAEWLVDPSAARATSGGAGHD